MAISEAVLPEFDHEMATTRRVLERVADDKLGWKPHEKSMSMGELATHLINIPRWTGMTINADSFDVNPPGEEPYKEPVITSRQQGLELFDKNVAEARAAIAGASDEVMMQPWTLLSGGQSLFTMPKAVVLRSFILNHNVHHRGQMSVYLRLNDIPVPSIYGPSADEDGM